MKNKIRELLNKNVTQDEYGNYILDAYPSDIENLVNELLEAINYTHSCESDSELLPNMTLEQAIEKAKPNMDKIKDVDKHIDNIR